MTPQAVAGLREICERGVSALAADEVDAVVAANAELHSAIVELSGNKVLAELAAQVDRRVRWYYTPVARQRGPESWTEHAALIDALAEHDGEQAAQIMREHTEHTRRSYHRRAKRRHVTSYVGGMTEVLCFWFPRFARSHDCLLRVIPACCAFPRHMISLLIG